MYLFNNRQFESKWLMFHIKYTVGCPSFPRKYGGVIRIRMAIPYVWLESDPEKILVFPNGPCNQIRGGIKFHQSVEQPSVERSLFMQRKPTEQDSLSWRNQLLDL